MESVRTEAACPLPSMMPSLRIARFRFPSPAITINITAAACAWPLDHAAIGQERASNDNKRWGQQPTTTATTTHGHQGRSSTRAHATLPLGKRDGSDDDDMTRISLGPPTFSSPRARLKKCLPQAC